MPNYHLKQKVDWREIMSIQRWYLEMRKMDYERLFPMAVQPVFKDELKAELLENLKLYQSLRKFLGYPNVTKIEKEILDILTPVVN